MQHAKLHNYLSRLRSSLAKSQLWLDDEGRARGRYFNASLTSAFQPIRCGTNGQLMAYEAYARSYDAGDQGLNVWRLLEHVANDEESVELDRLCRLLHAINFYRQPESAGLDLYLSVHSRLLAAVEGNHGAAFRRILDTLELPHEAIILQMPLITASQRWVLTHVAESYQRNGFRLGVHAHNLEQAADLLTRLQPAAIKLDISTVPDPDQQLELLTQAQRQGCRVIFRRIERETSWRTLQLNTPPVLPFFVQGFLFDLPKAQLRPETVAVSATLPLEVQRRFAHGG